MAKLVYKTPDGIGRSLNLGMDIDGFTIQVTQFTASSSDLRDRLWEQFMKDIQREGADIEDMDKAGLYLVRNTKRSPQSQENDVRLVYLFKVGRALAVEKDNRAAPAGLRQGAGEKQSPGIIHRDAMLLHHARREWIAVAMESTRLFIGPKQIPMLKILHDGMTIQMGGTEFHFQDIEEVVVEADFLKRLKSGSACPYCGDVFVKGDRVIRCPSCGTLQHAVCWRGMGIAVPGQRDAVMDCRGRMAASSNGIPASPVVVVKRRDRYDRLRSIDWWDQERLRNARILVAGAGALGNEVLKNLALVGVGHILIVDFDRMDVTNLSRAVLFRPGDENRSKAELAARRVVEINPDVQAEALDGDAVWDIGLGTLARFDAVIGCVDNREARLGLNRHCWKVNVPWIDGALGALSGQVRIFTPPDSACYECGFTDRDYQELNLRYSCQILAEEIRSTGHISTTPVSASITAAIQVQELLKLLHGIPVRAGYEIEYDGQYHKYHLTRLKRREDCLSHESIPWKEVIPLPEMQAATATAGQLLRIIRARMGEDAYVLLDREVITAMVCLNGHGADKTVRPLHRTGASQARCPACGLDRVVHMEHKIYNDSWMDISLISLGIPPGHILAAGYGEEWRYFELSGDILFGEPLFRLDRKEK